MKFTILFVGLLSLLIVNVNAFGEPGEEYYEMNQNSVDCEGVFNVTTCNECQKAIFNAWSSDSTCGFTISIIENVIEKYTEAAKHSEIKPYDMGPYNDAVTQTCGEEFTCQYEEAEKIWKEVEKSCPEELSTEVDWSADPTTIDVTVASAYGTIIFYYLGIPDHNAICLKSSSGELCGIEYIEPMIEWLKENFPDGDIIISYDGKFVYTSDGSKHEIPRELITCTECMKKMGEEYKTWPEEHPLPDYLVHNIFGSWEEVAEYYTCPNDNAKMKLKRALGRRLSTGPGLAKFRFRFRF